MRPQARCSWARLLVSDTGYDMRPGLAHRDFWQKTGALVDRHPLVADTALAGFVAVISTAWLVQRPGPSLEIWAVQFGLVAPLIWRRRRPVAVFVVIGLVALVQYVLGPELVADAALLVALYTLGSQRARPVAGAGALLVEVGAALASSRWSLAGSWARSFVFLSGLVAAALLLGTNMRARRARIAVLTERAVRLERERDQQAQIAAAAERARIAREMHDVIAHSLAVIISVADGAAAKLRAEPGPVSDAVASVASIGRQALSDTRRLLGILRSDDGPQSLAPQPGIAQLQDLVQQFCKTGLAASLLVEGQPRPLPPGEELTVYRVVQEAMTNVIKHASGASMVKVRLLFASDSLEVQVNDNGSAPADNWAANTGHGLDGMRERVAIFGGRVSAGPEQAGWEVCAHIPLDPSPVISPELWAASP